MRSRKEIKADFERTMPQRKEEQLNFHRQKLIFEAIMNVDEKVGNLIDTLNRFNKQLKGIPL